MNQNWIGPCRIEKAGALSYRFWYIHAPGESLSSFSLAPDTPDDVIARLDRLAAEEWDIAACGLPDGGLRFERYDVMTHGVILSGRFVDTAGADAINGIFATLRGYNR